MSQAQETLKIPLVFEPMSAEGILIIFGLAFIFAFFLVRILRT